MRDVMCIILMQRLTLYRVVCGGMLAWRDVVFFLHDIPEATTAHWSLPVTACHTKKHTAISYSRGKFIKFQSRDERSQSLGNTRTTCSHWYFFPFTLITWTFDNIFYNSKKNQVQQKYQCRGVNGGESLCFIRCLFSPHSHLDKKMPPPTERRDTKKKLPATSR